MVGSGVGWAVGSGVGWAVGSGVGCAVGTGLGCGVGTRVGRSVGRSVGSGVGTSEGTGVGTSVGTGVGTSEGSGLGRGDGGRVGGGGEGDSAGTLRCAPSLHEETRVLLMPCVTDRYFEVPESAREVELMNRNAPRIAQLAPIPSSWGHRAGDPSRAGQLDQAAFITAHIKDLLKK